MSEPFNIDDTNFDETVLQSKIPVLVDFWAPWCGPCKMVAPIVEELASEYDGKIVFGKVNVDENSQIAGKYGIMGIPTLVIFKDGQPISNLVGFRGKDQLKESLEDVLG
ncbi:thioredoxin [Chloroflexota bacterium]